MRSTDINDRAHPRSTQSIFNVSCFMETTFQPKTITVDGLSVRIAEGGQDGPDAILMSPLPESVYAFEPAWPRLAAAAHLVAIDPPGFGGSDYRQTLMNPKAMGHFILNVADALGLDNPH